MKKYMIRTMLLLAVCVSAAACFNVDEEVFDRVNNTAFYQDETSVKGAIASIYYNMEAPYEHFYMLNEFPADQIAWRIWNGGTWGYDEGEKYVLSTHTWTAEAKIINSAWTGTWASIGLCNQLLYDLGQVSAADLGMTQAVYDAYIAEVRTLRVWSYYLVFELWGGVIPLNTKSASETAELPQSESKVQGSFEAGCKSIWNFMATELDESYAALPKNSVNRANQAMNRTLKARLLLNAQLWIGEDKFSECATLCQSILNGDFGTYEIASDYHKIYDYGNTSSCKEIIFAYAWGDNMTHGNAKNYRNGPFIPSSKPDELFGYEKTMNGWNCVILVPSYDNSGTKREHGGSTGAVSFLDSPYNDKLGAIWARFDDKDIRKQAYHCDAAGKWDGIALIEEQTNWRTGAVYQADADRLGEPLVYVDQVGTFKGVYDPTSDGNTISHEVETVMSPRWGETNSGYRLIRYPIYPDEVGINYMDIDQVEFRLSEVVYMLAECKLRAGDADAAKDLVDSVRKRYFSAANQATALASPGPGFTAFDLDWMLNEWGKEFLGEGCRRRTDLRRFDKFTQGQWWFFGRCSEGYPAQRDRKYEWYPLPASALLVNMGLEQNPNY